VDEQCTDDHERGEDDRERREPFQFVPPPPEQGRKQRDDGDDDEEAGHGLGVRLQPDDDTNYNHTQSEQPGRQTECAPGQCGGREGGAEPGPAVRGEGRVVQPPMQLEPLLQGVLVDPARAGRE